MICKSSIVRSFSWFLLFVFQKAKVIFNWELTACRSDFVLICFSCLFVFSRCFFGWFLDSLIISVFAWLLEFLSGFCCLWFFAVSNLSAKKTFFLAVLRKLFAIFAFPKIECMKRVLFFLVFCYRGMLYVICRYLCSFG